MAWKGEKSSGYVLEKTETQPQWGLCSWKEAERRKWGVCSQKEKHKVDKKWGFGFLVRARDVQKVKDRMPQPKLAQIVPNLLHEWLWDRGRWERQQEGRWGHPRG